MNTKTKITTLNYLNELRHLSISISKNFNFNKDIANIEHYIKIGSSDIYYWDYDIKVCLLDSLKRIKFLKEELNKLPHLPNKNKRRLVRQQKVKLKYWL